MKICKHCFSEFEGDDVLDLSPATKLNNIMLQNIGVEDLNDLCSRCKEELGVMNLLGFGGQ